MPNIADRKAPNAATVAIAADLAPAADVPEAPAASVARAPVASAALVRADPEALGVPAVLVPAVSAVRAVTPAAVQARALVPEAPVVPGSSGNPVPVATSAARAATTVASSSPNRSSRSTWSSGPNPPACSRSVARSR